jgi:hypothetical protein
VEGDPVHLDSHVDRAVRVVALAACLLALEAGAQGTSVLTGRVTDAATGAPVVDALVAISSAALGGQQVAVTDDAGIYRVHNLPPGVYALRFDKQAYRPLVRAEVPVRSGITLRINVQLVSEAERGAHAVAAEVPPSVDVGAATTGVTLDRDFLARVPLARPDGAHAVTRSFEPVVDAAPGAQPDAHGFSLSGTTSPENVYLIDGLTVDDPALGSLGLPLTLEFVQEVNVTTGGYMPEHGRGTGGRVNVVTRSGSNAFRGALWSTWIPGGLTAVPRRREEDRPTELRLHNAGDLGATLGGPLMKDKLWFFAGFSSGLQRDVVTGGDTRRFTDLRAHQYIGKLSYLFNEDHDVALSVIGAPASSERQASPHGVSFRYAGAYLEKRALVDAAAGWHHQTTARLPADGTSLGAEEGLAGRPQVLLQDTGAPGLTAIGGPGELHRSALDRLEARVAGTYLLRALGLHVFKAGVDLESARYQSARAYSGGVIFREREDRASFETHRMYGYLEAPDQGVVQRVVTARTTSHSVGTFLQDSWQVLDLFTLNAGIRYDQQRLHGDDGRLAVQLGDQWSPRVGLVYDFTRRGRSRLFAHYARYHERVPLGLVHRAFPRDSLLYARYGGACDPTVAPDAQSGECQVFGADRRTVDNPNRLSDFEVLGGDSVSVDRTLRPRSSDEWVVGAEYEVLPRARAGLTYTRRDMNHVLELMSRDGGRTVFLGNPGHGEASDFPTAARNYDAVSAYFHKTFADGWLGHVSYTWSRLQGNHPGLSAQDPLLPRPQAPPPFDPDTLFLNRTGLLPLDSTHSVKAFGAREFVLTPTSVLDVGFAYRGRTGAPLSQLGARPVLGSEPVFHLPRGTAGRLPWQHQVDGQLGYSHRLAQQTTVTLTLEVFNLFDVQAPTAVDQRFEPGSANPDFGRPTAYQPPRAARLGARLTF